MTEPTPVLLVDLSSIGHPIWHVSQQEPDPDYTSQRTAAIVRQLAADHPHTAICCDAPGSFRKKLDASYKANRPVAEAALHHQINLAKEALAADGFPIWEVNGFEGDDLIATATKKLTETYVCSHSGASVTLPLEHRVLIASADKDLLALVSDHVEVHSTRTGDRIGPAEVREKLGVDPCQVVDYLTLVGDTADNIKGAKGIGPKTAAGMLGIFGNLDDIYHSIDAEEGEELKPSWLASLEELRPRLDAVRALVTMRTDVPLDVAAVFKERVPKVAETFMEDEMDEEPAAAEGTPTGTTPTPERVLGQEFPRLPPSESSDHAVMHQIKPDPPPAPPKKQQPESTALVPVVASEPEEWDRRLEPRCMADAVRFAQRMHDSRMFLGDYGTPQAVLGTILLGRELGIPAMASLRTVHIIDNKHSLSADLMVALVLKSGMAEYFQMVESTENECTFETKRKGNPHPQKLTYTILQAKQAGLLQPTRSGKPSNWQKMPKQMLRARAKSELARLEFPDLLAGLYTPEELRDAKVEVA